MTTLLLNGVLMGLSLTFMVGPLLFAVVEASLARGFRAGLAVACGMWASDALFVAAIVYGLDAFSALAVQPSFRLAAGIGGGALLCVFGAGSLFFSPKNSAPHLLDTAPAPAEIRWKMLAGHWLKGFLLNVVNPGTIFFWLGVASAIVVPSRWESRQTLVFFAAMLGTLALTDALKAYAAERLRALLTPAHIRQVQRSIGIVLLAIGLGLIGRAAWFS